MNKKNLLIIHGGGPTAVLNASLYGAITEAEKCDFIHHIYGARNGAGGLLREELIPLETLTDMQMRCLLQTPGSAIGTSRDPLEQKEYDRMADLLVRHEIAYVLCNGGNGTMDTCGKLRQACEKKKYDIKVVGIPKTMDNDISVTDHSPGFGSAARYMAQSVREVCADVQGLPIHVVVIEASGRNAGWITAASVMADQGDGLGPDLIYVPERPFDEEAYLEDVKRLLKKKSGIVVVASEGLKNSAGDPVVKPIFQVGRATYFGDVSAHLANLVIQKLGYKARGEKPGLLGRASMSHVSDTDREEAILMGETACRAVLQGQTGKMAALRRVSTNPYQVQSFLADIEEVMLYERKLPDAFINEAGNGVTEAFREWCRPLIGPQFPQMITLNERR